jgi:hypothetical protein
VIAYTHLFSLHPSIISILSLPASVTTVDDEVGTSGVCASVGSEVDVSTLQLLGITVTSHWDHAHPEVLGVLVDEVAKTGVNVPGRDTVDTGKVAPLVGQAPGHVDGTCLGDVVAGLLLWEVGDVAGHGGGDDEASGLALLEVVADGLGAVCGAVQVGLDDLVPLLDSTVEETAVGGTAGIGNKDVDLAEVGNDVLDKLLAVGKVADVALVGLGLDVVLLLEVLDVLFGTIGTGRVGDGDVGTVFGAATGCLNSHAPWAGGTGDDHDLLAQVEQVLELGLLGDGDRHDGGL